MRTVPKPSQLVSTAPLRIADEERSAEIVSEWAVTHRRPSGRVVTIATDGAYHRAVGGGAVAWVSDDGRHGAARARCSSSFHTELIAIDEAIRAQP
ncbi:hypothetical protein [Rathayibacter sp. Leaf296]|uniref:hypothetical protein n=1 Tax=Rathayibacter sp. Leaf296 TaxID=1736327 RepID=UPI000702DCCD|nr:hypothetical protein [Rathayibacter sp. Leaf296]KQQ09754.1 hypothetical protein ASF46_01110 [Rathayibacter sp. Leaf296]